MRRGIIALVLIGAAAVAACSGGASGSGGGSAASPADTAASGAGAGAAASAPLASMGAGSGASLPFGGDACQSLTAADFTAAGLTGYTLESTKATDGLVGPKSACLYHLTNTSAGIVEPDVNYMPPDAWDFDKTAAQKDSSFQQLSGIGDDAYLGNAMGSLTLSLKAKGYYIDISGVSNVGGVDDATALKSLATALVGRLQ